MSRASYRSGIAAALVLLAAVGCAKTIDIEDLEGRVTSIGPIFVDGDGLTTVRFSVYDTDSDPVDVNAEYRVADTDAWTSLPDCVPDGVSECEVIGGLVRLPTDQDRDVQYQIGWRIPDELDGEQIQLRMYVSADATRGVQTDFVVGE